MTNFKVSPKVAAFAVTILFIASFWGASVAKAQDTLCPPGMTRHDFTMMVGRCLWHGYICANCTCVTHPVVELDHLVLWPDTSCHSAYNYEEVEAFVWSQIENPAFVYNNLCFWPPNPPPCPQSFIEITERHANCYQAECHDNGWGLPITVYMPCEGSTFCTEVVRWCWQAPLGPYIRTTVSQSSPAPNCILRITDVTIPYEIGDPPSACFRVGNICNP